MCKPFQNELLFFFALPPNTSGFRLQKTFQLRVFLLFHSYPPPQSVFVWFSLLCVILCDGKDVFIHFFAA